MNSRWKKLVSLFLALSIVCSLVVVPAAAADTALTLSFENGKWSGQTYTVDVAAHGSGSFKAAVAAITIGFEKDILTFVSSTDKTGFAMAVEPDATEANKDGSFNLGPTDLDGRDFNGTMPIATLVFQVKDPTAESQNTELTFSSAKIGRPDATQFTVASAQPIVVSVPGAAPVLDSVTLPSGGDSVEIDGTAAKTVQAVAKSAKGTDITASVEWSVSPAGQGVTVEKGLVTVDGKAKAAAYTVTAKSGSVEKSVTVTVTRAASTATSVAILRDGKAVTEDTLIIPATGSAEYTYTAELLDQYGDKMTGESAAWTAANQPEGVQFVDGKVTVSSTQEEAEFTVTATVSGKSGSVKVSLKRISITWPTATASGVYGQTWSEIVKLSGGSAELNGDKVDGTFSVKNGDVRPAAGEQTYIINFKSANGAYDVDSSARATSIAKKPITIKMDDHKRAYGDTFRYYEFNTVVRGEPVLVGDSVEAVASVPGTAGDGTDAVGTYTIKGTATHDNYDVKVTDGVLTIEKKGVAPEEELPELKVVGNMKTEVDSDTGRTIITGSLEASAPEARSLTALLEAISKRNPDMVPGETTFTLKVGENTATFTFKRWSLAPGQTFEGPGRYEIIPEWECDNAEIAASYEPNLPKLFVDVAGEKETLSVNGGKTWKLYISDIEKAGRLNDLLPSHAYYRDNTKVSITGWTYSDGTSVTLSNLLRKAKNGDSIILYPVVSLSYLDVQSLTVRFYNDPGNSGSTSGNGNGNGTGGNISFTIDPEQIFLNFDLPKDVSRSYWAAPYIAWAYQRGVMNGTGNGNFTPNGLTNRQQLWMVLARLSGEKPADMAAARVWAVSTGVSDGTNPGGSLTRQQLVAMLYRYAQSKGCDVSVTGSLNGYVDAGKVSSYARQAMSWAVANGIVTGTADKQLNPQGTASRAHFAAMMFRFCAKYGV